MIFFLSPREQAFEEILPLDYSIVKRYFKDKEEIQIDLETTGFNPRRNSVRTIQLGDSDNQFVLETSDITPLKELLENKTLILQNAKFDLRFLYIQGVYPRKVWDTFLCERIIYNGVVKPKGFFSLGGIIERRLGVVIDKGLQGQVNKAPIDSAFVQYAANDVKYLQRVKQQQINDAEKYNLLREMELNNNFVRALAYVENCGFKIDAVKWQKRIDKYKNLSREVVTKLDSIANSLGYKGQQISLFSEVSGINWNSPKQVIPIFKSLNVGLDLLVEDEKNGGMKYSLDKKVLAPQKHKHPLIPIYIEYSEYQKQLSTYGSTFLDSMEEDRIYTQFTQIVNTGRLSSGGKNQYGQKFHNLHNIPSEEETRSCFVAKDGNSLGISDYSGQETCILAELAKDKVYARYISDPDKDLHCLVASLAYPELVGLSHPDIKKNHSEKRSYVKPGTFCIPYGGNEFTIATNLSFPVEVGKRIYDGVMSEFPGLANYFESQRKKSLKYGYVVLNKVTKGRSYFNEWPELKRLKEEIDWKLYWDYRKEGIRLPENIYRKVQRYNKLKSIWSKRYLNYPIQGTGAAMTKLAATKFFEHILDSNLQGIVLINNLVHDEIDIEAPDNIIKEQCEKLKYYMEDAAKVFVATVPMEANPKISKYWTK